ncbi:hypothetical protein R1sor_018583 [Riccia sorocarpa]|uniref:DNA-binding protein S1FA n=1 Tax=Riccia sorocarpa TaxID=122646 RepID=A0ABD3IB55_9MARC
MADDDMDASAFSRQGTFSTKAPDQGFNPALIVLLVVVGTVLIFIVGNYALFTYARKTLPPRKKKPVSKKKLKRERLKAGVAPAGD